MAQLSRARDRSMHSIVATIQAEQDKAIRAPGKGVVSISGGPGTGKTVVALHRAAYLLYNDRRRYETGGVLIVGPSGVFMRYIERVLPSLGETAVALRSLGEVVDGVRATRHDEPAVADVKGSARMAELLRRVVAPAGAGQPDRVPDLLPRRHPRPRPRRPRPGPPPADVAGPPQPAAARGSPARCSTRCGARCAASAAASAVARPSTTTCSATTSVPRLRRRPGGRRSTPREVLRLAARPRAAGPGRRRRRSAPRSSAAAQVVDAARPRRPTCRSRTSPLLDELRYALGDVPARTDDERDRPDSGAARGRRDMQELMTAADREYAPSGRAWAPPTHRIEDDPLRPRAHRRGAGPHPDAVADGRPPRPHRVVDHRRRPGAVVVAGARRGRGGPRRGARGQGASTSSTSPPTTATPPRSTPSPRRTPSASGSTPTCPPRCARPVSSPAGRRGRRRPRGRRPARRSSSSPARSRGTVGIVVPVARRSEVNAWLASWPELADDAPGARAAAVDASVAPSGEDRVVVLTGLDTKGLEFDGDRRRAPAGDRGRVGHRPRDPLRRADPRHAAAHHRLLRVSRPGGAGTAASSHPTIVGSLLLALVLGFAAGWLVFDEDEPDDREVACAGARSLPEDPGTAGTPRWPTGSTASRCSPRAPARPVRASTTSTSSGAPDASSRGSCATSSSSGTPAPARRCWRPASGCSRLWSVSSVHNPASRRTGAQLGCAHDCEDLVARDAIDALQGHEAWAIIRRSTRAG